MPKHHQKHITPCFVLLDCYFFCWCELFQGRFCRILGSVVLSTLPALLIKILTIAIPKKKQRHHTQLQLERQTTKKRNFFFPPQHALIFRTHAFEFNNYYQTISKTQLRAPHRLEFRF
ncbi:hypothetical protein Ancab_030828 [Ancistrocladus abbreviatus]